MKSLQILEWRGLPQVEAAGVVVRGDEGQLDARRESEDAIASRFENPVTATDEVVLLAASLKVGELRLGV